MDVLVVCKKSTEIGAIASAICAMIPKIKDNNLSCIRSLFVEIRSLCNDVINELAE